MTQKLDLQPVDQIEITTLYENLVDSTAPGAGPVERLRGESGGAIVSDLLAEERRIPFVGGHGLSMQVRITRGGLSRTLLFDAGGSPEGLVNNLDCLEINPRDWNCIVLSHGHWDHTLGLIGLQHRLGRLDFPLTLHPDAYLKRVTVQPNGETRRLTPLSRQGLRDAGVKLIESENPSFVVEGMALVTTARCGRPGCPDQQLRDRLARPPCRTERSLGTRPTGLRRPGTSDKSEGKGSGRSVRLRPRRNREYGNPCAGDYRGGPSARNHRRIPPGASFLPRPRPTRG